MPQPVSNTLTVVSGSLLANKISYVVDGQNRNYRGGYGGLSWMSEAEATNNVIFIGNTSTIGRGPADKPLFYPSFNTSDANIIYAANTLPGSPRNLSTVAGAYGWAANNNFFINSANSPIPRIDADGLVLYVDANQPTSYPQTNNDWFDLSGFGNNGTLTNGPSWNSRGYFEFDGADDYVSFGNLGTIGHNQTIEVWFNSNAVQNYRNVLDMNYSTYNPNTGNVGPRLEQYSTSQIVWIWSGNTTNNGIYNFTTLENISANRWYHTVFTLNSGAWQWHLNGTLIQSGTSPQGYITTYGDVNVGRGFILDPSRYFSGFQSSVRIYNKTLSTSEVKQNYFQGNIVTDGLVFMLDPNNLVSYPRSGTTSYSLTGSNTATLFNGVGYNNLNGGSWQFDGVDDYISSTVTGLPTGASPRTVNIWVKITGTTGNPYFALCGYGSPALSQTFDLGFNDTTDTVFLDIYGAGGIGSVSSITKNEWHMITGIYTGTQLQLYIDGVLEATNNYVINTANSSFEISDTAWGYPAPLTGNVGNVSIYNRALSINEIQQNYQATKYKFQGPQMVTQGLVMYLDAANKDSYSGTGNTWYDLSGNSNNATKNGNSANPVWNSAGGYFAFAASDGSVGANNIFTVANSATLQNLTDITVQFICAMETKTPVGSDYDWMCIVTKGEEGGNQKPGTSVNQLPGNRYYHIETPTGVNSVGDLFTNADYTGNKWNLFQTRVSNAGGTQGWLNGTQVSTAGATTTGNTSPLYIGSNGYFELFKGKMGVVCIYNRALSDAELVQNYNFFKTRFGL